MINNICSVILSILSISGGFFIVNKSYKYRFIGFTIWTIANIGWIIISVDSKLIGQLPMWIIYLFTSIYGMYNNRKPNDIGGNN